MKVPSEPSCLFIFAVFCGTSSSDSFAISWSLRSAKRPVDDGWGSFAFSVASASLVGRSDRALSGCGPKVAMSVFPGQPVQRAHANTVRIHWTSERFSRFVHLGHSFCCQLCVAMVSTNMHTEFETTSKSVVGYIIAGVD